jgi:hypothetical protein
MTPIDIAQELDELITVLVRRRKTSRYGKTAGQRSGYKQGLYDAAAILAERRHALAGVPTPVGQAQ